MDILFCIIGIILCIVGVIGSILPGLPGPQLAYLGIVCAQFFMDKPFSWSFIIIWGILIIFITILDYYLPILGTKKFGGTKLGNRGCIAGMIVGMFFGPAGLILGPFGGALIGEYLKNKNVNKSIKPALGAFIGFISGVLLKLVVSIILLVYLCIGSYNHFFGTLDSLPTGGNELTAAL